MLQIYNTLTRQKQPFHPINPKKVGIYVCGMTVYDYCHLGHARMLVGFDMITRYLRYRGYNINYVRNITDIDDKIIKRAKEENVSFEEIVKRYTNAMDEDLSALGVIPPDLEPRATDHIPTIVDMIQKLIDNNYAYVAENNDIYYKVNAFKNYGQLSGKELENMRAGARVDIVSEKHDPFDFALWKAAKAGEPSWPSPWGRGRPGWHIECSAMSTKCLGNHFDIHGGGPDLVFPHHENEIAQSEAATGENFVNIWMHVGGLQFRDEKMSKSLGNFCTIREALKDFAPEVIRYFLISSHYRSPINFSESAMRQASQALSRFYTTLRGLHEVGSEITNGYDEQFQKAMDDDFNTPMALATLFDMTHEINRLKETDFRNASRLGAGLRQLGGVLGLLQDDADSFLHGVNQPSEEIATIESLVAERNVARKNENWELADKIRAKLADLGVELEDTGTNTIWRRSR